MQAKKCDICGTLYEQQCTPDVRINIYIHPHGDEWLDICPKCQENLENWISGCWQYKALHKDNAPIPTMVMPGVYGRNGVLVDTLKRKKE